MEPQAPCPGGQGKWPWHGLGVAAIHADGRQPRWGLTVTVSLVRAVLAVHLAVTAQTQVHTLTPCAGELGGRAHRAALLITLVVALREAVTAPGPWDAVDLASGTCELVGGAGGRLWGWDTEKVTQRCLLNLGRV